MNVGSLFSGIGGIDLGLERAGMRVVFQAEADPWRRAVLRSHWPDIPCYEDVRDVGHRQQLGDESSGDQPRSIAAARNGTRRRTVTSGREGACDLLCGGFPCQDLSVAGRRAGLAGARSSLFFEFARIADLVRPSWLLIENVPGLLSSNSGRDFAVVLSTLADLGYGVAWRVLDSRHFGVPQRRRRVFVVGHSGAQGAAPFLPFLEGGEGDSAEGGEAGTESAFASLSGLGSGGPDDNDGQGGRLVTGFHHIQDPISSEGMTPALGQEGLAVAAPLSHGSNPNSNAAGRRRKDDENLVTVGALTGGNTPHGPRGGPQRLDPHSVAAGQYAATENCVRRLTPTECCRLQGFPDDWLGPPSEPPDSPRYAALGDAVTVPVAEWIGRRILEAERSVAA